MRASYVCAGAILGTTIAHASSASACPADNSHATGAAWQAILDYKNRDHQIMAAYFRSWRDIASGRSVSGLQSTFNTYRPFVSSGQYLIGFGFHEENGADWGDVSSPLNTSRAYKYAQWQPAQGTKGASFPMPSIAMA